MVDPILAALAAAGRPLTARELVADGTASAGGRINLHRGFTKWQF